MSDDNVPSMMEYSDDITGAQPPVPLPNATWVGEIVEAVAKTSAKGNNYASVGFMISADQYPVDFIDGNPDGTKLYYNRVPLDDSVRGRFLMKRWCETIGAPMGRKIDLNDWMGKRALVTTQSSEWEGMPRAEIVKVESVNS